MSKLCLLLLLVGSQFLFSSSADDATTNITMTETDHGPMDESKHVEDKCAEHEESFDSQVRIYRLEFERVQTLIIITVFIMVVVLAKLGKAPLLWASCSQVVSPASPFTHKFLALWAGP